MPAIDPRRLRPTELTQLLNSTPLGAVTGERQIHRHRTRAGFRLGDGRHVDLFRYVAWLVEERHTPREPRHEVDYEALKERARARNAALSLAGKRDFAAISKLLTKWREEEAEIVERIDRWRDALEPLPEALEIIRQFGFVKGKLQAADRVKVQYALQQTVPSIRVGTWMAKTGEITCREHFGELRFHEALLPDKVMAIPDEAIGQRKIWREIGELVRQAKGPLHLADFAEYIGTKDASRAAHHVRKAEKAGLMKKIGWVGGWVAIG